MRRSDKVGLTVGALVLGAGLAAAIVADLGREERGPGYPTAVVAVNLAEFSAKSGDGLIAKADSAEAVRRTDKAVFPCVIEGGEAVCEVANPPNPVTYDISLYHEGGWLTELSYRVGGDR